MATYNVVREPLYKKILFLSLSLFFSMFGPKTMRPFSKYDHEYNARKLQYNSHYTYKDQFKFVYKAIWN